MMIAQILGDIRELRADVRGWNTDSDRRITSLERRMSDSESDRKQIKEFLDQIRGGKVRSKDLGYWAMVTIAIVNGLIALTAIFGSPT